MRIKSAASLGTVAVNAVLLLLINVEPGWRVVPFLTEDAAAVLPYVNTSLAAGAVGGLMQLLVPTAWMRGLTGAVGSCFALVATLALWRVFPFDAPDPWPGLLRVLLALGILGSIVGIISGLAGFVGGLFTGRTDSAGSRTGSSGRGPAGSPPS